MIRIGIDVGSTTAKMVALGHNDELLFTRYERHNARTKELIVKLLQELVETVGDEVASLRITGSVGMGVAETHTLPFVQEVVAATYAIRRYYPRTRSMIDIGGEDAKVVFFHNGQAADLRMNGNCAGGTGAFIDQMAVILGVDVDALGELALRADRIYPIASRCGVFCKTDIQNLIAKNVSRENIAASIFHAVTVQTVVTLAHGCDITAPVLFCGGPLTFIPALRKAFTEYLGLRQEEVILPEKGTLLPALGAALAPVEGDDARGLSAFIARLESGLRQPASVHSHLAPIFENAEAYEGWKARMSRYHVQTAALRQGRQEVLIGIDSGSTTTKIVVTDPQGKLLFSFYRANGGNPIEAVEEGLNAFKAKCLQTGTQPFIVGSCSTGYGEDLVRAAFQLDAGIVETIAHHIGAHHFNREVSFILDIGGQDMKAIFVTGGVIDRIEINEACSSGCGSFIETFAKTLGYTAGDFALAACRSAAPCDLGTRCTVFMNSKVKQVLREGATLDDIAAGLAYSVVKNCLYKVLKLKDTSVLGKHIVVQGGTMRNDAIVRALELLTGAEVTRCDIPELMGAYGCARYAGEHRGRGVTLDEMIGKARYSTRFLHCKGCDNRCLVVRYLFDNGKAYFSGNRCEKVFTNGQTGGAKGVNVYTRKNELLFNRNVDIERPALTIGIPRCLNMYEEYPFWHALFTACGIRVALSDLSNFLQYEKNARMVMSDNICFPAKLVHSHIQDLLAKRVDRIFMPFVIFEKAAGEQNSYNCPIV
ncbi:MAG: acyl-CoA dehydratase activase, partial [Prevotellaceae bacterium]|nr:acyl-CoA dehydratase activase [Prevotellaceae bacterium]